MKLTKFCIIIFGLFLLACGTSKPTYITTNETNFVDTTKLKCTYQFRFLKDSIKMIYDDDLNIIQIGKNFTKSYCYQTFYLDSLTDNGTHITFNFDEFRDAISTNNTTYLKKHTYGSVNFFKTANE